MVASSEREGDVTTKATWRTFLVMELFLSVLIVLADT